MESYGDNFIYLADSAGYMLCEDVKAHVGIGIGNSHAVIETGVDLLKIMDVAEDAIAPLMDQKIRVGRKPSAIGYAGVYSTFLLFAKRAATKYGRPVCDILSSWAAGK